MTRIISFANQKGGVGKSTLCLQMAFYLAEQVKKVLVIDFDPQGNTSSRLAPKDEESEPIFTGTATKTLFKKNCGTITPMSCPSGVDLIHSQVNDVHLAELESMSLDKTTVVKTNLESTISEYDYVLVDCPPSLGRKLVAALSFSTHVVCPIKLSGFAMAGVEGLLTTIVNVQHFSNQSLKIVGIVINQMNASASHKKILKNLQDEIPELVLQNIIKDRSPIEVATNEGIPVWSLNYGHVAAKEVKLLLDEILYKVNA